MKREHLIHSAITDGAECICNPEVLIGDTYGSWNLQKKVSPKGTLLDLNAAWKLFTGKSTFLESTFNSEVHEQKEIGEDGTIYEEGDITYTLIDGDGNPTNASFTIKKENKIVTGVEYDANDLILFFSSSHKKNLGDVYAWIRPVLDSQGNPVMEDGVPLIYDYIQIPIQTIFEDYETQTLFPWFADDKNNVKLRSALANSDKNLGRFAITQYSEVFFAQQPDINSEVYLTSLPLYLREILSILGVHFTEAEVSVDGLEKIKRVSGNTLFNELATTSIVQAIKEDRTSISNLSTSIQNINNNLGNFSELQTDTTIVNSINALLLKTNINRNKIGYENENWKVLNTENKGDLITSINEINSNLQSLSSIVSTNYSNLDTRLSNQQSINQEVSTNIQNLDSTTSLLHTQIGDISSLTTENKNTIVNSINELKFNIEEIELQSLDNVEELREALDLDDSLNEKVDKSTKVITNKYVSDNSSVTQTINQELDQDIILDLKNSFGFDKSHYQLKEEKGQPNGYVPLNNDGQISSQYLPSYVDSIVDVYATYTINNGNITNISLYSDSEKTQQLVEGNIGTIYSDVESPLQFRWTGSQFISISSSTLVIGTVTGTAFDGARGYLTETLLNDHINSGSVSGNIVYNPNPHNVQPYQLTVNNVNIGEGEINIDLDSAIKNIYSRLNTVEEQSNLNTAHIGSMSNISESSLTQAISSIKSISRSEILSSISTYLVYGEN